MVEKPSQIIKHVLSGKVRLEDVDEGIQSWCRFFFYQGACAVLSRETKKERQEALKKIPEIVRPYVEEEAIRLWRLRHQSQ